MKLSQLVGTDLFMPPEWDREFNHVVTDSRDVQKAMYLLRAKALKSMVRHILKRPLSKARLRF